jgi:hypothetical protein
MKKNCASSWLFTEDEQDSFTGFDVAYPGKNVLTNVSETTSASLLDPENEDNVLTGIGQISTGLQGFTSKASAACYTAIHPLLQLHTTPLAQMPIDCTAPC